jgi:hypothetical protein
MRQVDAFLEVWSGGTLLMAGTVVAIMLLVAAAAFIS